MNARFALAVLAYLVPTFALGFVWHLVLFERNYQALDIYRPDIIIPFGFLSMLMQAIVFAWIYQRAFGTMGGPAAALAARYGLLGAVLSWTFTTLAVAAKNRMNSVPDFLIIETGFTLVQWLMVAPATVLVFRATAQARRASATPA